MKVNKRIRCIKYALAIVWCAQLLLLGGCSETEESTWKYALSLIDGLKQLVPEELTEELSTALQNNTLEAYVAEISAEYVLLQENEIMQYIRKDTSGVLESFYYEYIEGGEEWFLFGRDNDIIVRQKIDNEKYPYCYYKFPCEGGVYGGALRAYGKNEDYYFISWEDDDYLLVTKRAEGQVNGLAVYQMYGYALIGWILGLEKTSDGEVEVTYYTYVGNGNYVWGERFLDY